MSKLFNCSNNGRHGLPKLVGIVHSDVRREYFPTEAQYITEKGAVSDAKTVAAYVEKLGVEVFLFPANADLPLELKKRKPSMVLNLVGSVRGSEYLASTVPALLELLEIPYTGAGILGESLSYNKFLVKKLLENNGIPVPNYQLFNSYKDMISPGLRYPLISKLNEIHGAVELTEEAVSESEGHLRQRLKKLIETYDQPVLVEEFIAGREITIYVVEGAKKKVYMGEKIFKGKKGKFVFADFERQWLEEENTVEYQKFKDVVLQEYAKKAFEVSKMADYGKFDVRLDDSSRYYFLDANSNPFFGPSEIESPMANVMSLYGVGFEECLKRLLLNTCSAN